jgi:ribonuclease BN (tRNA processing enzyme)
MKIHTAILTSLSAMLCVTQACADLPPTCPPADGVAVQVLGSGGPIADDARASSAYLVWVDGKARVLIDAGGGSFLRFGEAQAGFSDLDFVGLSHFHADHSAGFPALLKSGNFANRKRPLTVAGPSGSDRFPGLEKYLTSILDSSDGAYAYLSGYLDGTRGLPKIDSIEVNTETSRGQDLLTGGGSEIAVYAMHVPHGIVPAIAFRVAVNGKTIVFSSDQNGSNTEFADFASDATLLIMHMPIPEDAGEGARQLHAIPSKIGEVAAAANAEKLLLSHFMARSLAGLSENVRIVRNGYEGEVLIAEDLYCHVIR